MARTLKTQLRPNKDPKPNAQRRGARYGLPSTATLAVQHQLSQRLEFAGAAGRHI